MTGRVSVVIPTLNEAEAIASVIAELPKDIVHEIIIADGGSHDGTQAIARAAGATVLNIKLRGYGQACATGAAVADATSDIIVFMDGDGADHGELIEKLIAPIRAGTSDFVMAARHKAGRAPGSMNIHQVVAGNVFGYAIGSLTGVRYTDMCAYRAISRPALETLNMQEMTYGWNIEMQMKAARHLRVLELPMPYRRRLGGASKVAGSWRGTITASWRIIMAFLRVATKKN